MRGTYTKVRIREGSGVTIDCMVGDAQLRRLQDGVDARRPRMIVRDAYGNLLPVCPRDISSIERKGMA